MLTCQPVSSSQSVFATISPLPGLARSAEETSKPLLLLQEPISQRLNPQSEQPRNLGAAPDWIALRPETSWRDLVVPDGPCFSGLRTQKGSRALSRHLAFNLLGTRRKGNLGRGRVWNRPRPDFALLRFSMLSTYVVLQDRVAVPQKRGKGVAA